MIDSGDHLAGLAEQWRHASGTRCLARLDPYADVTFQETLLSRLREELEQVCADALPAASRAVLEALIGLVCSACEQSGASVCFLGD